MPCDDRSDKTKVPFDWPKLKAKSDSTPHLRLSFMKQIKVVSNPGDFSGPKRKGWVFFGQKQAEVCAADSDARTG